MIGPATTQSGALRNGANVNDDGNAAAAWYPTEDGRLRYWDGTQWTPHFAPVPAPSAHQRAYGALFLRWFAGGVAFGVFSYLVSSGPKSAPFSSSWFFDVSWSTGFIGVVVGLIGGGIHYAVARRR